MELKFHNAEKLFYDENGKLQKEPRASLKTLLKRYDKACEQYSQLRKKMKEAEAPYRKMRWKHNNEPTFIEDRVRNFGHRTRANAQWADITIAFAVDFNSPGEITTKEAAGDNYIAVQIPEDGGLYCRGDYSKKLDAAVKDLREKIRSHPSYSPKGTKLNIAGNGASSLARAGFSVEDAMDFITIVLSRTMSQYDNNHLAIKEVRSGGQTGADEAGIIAAQGAGLKCSILAPKGYRMIDADGVEHADREEFISRFKESYVDYDEWDEKDPDGCWTYGLGEFNGFNALDQMQYDIDLKIMHMNSRGEG